MLWQPQIAWGEHVASGMCIRLWAAAWHPAKARYPPTPTASWAGTVQASGDSGDASGLAIMAFLRAPKGTSRCKGAGAVFSSEAMDARATTNLVDSPRSAFGDVLRLCTDRDTARRECGRAGAVAEGERSRHRAAIPRPVPCSHRWTGIPQVRCHCSAFVPPASQDPLANCISCEVGAHFANVHNALPRHESWSVPHVSPSNPRRIASQASQRHGSQASSARGRGSRDAGAWRSTGLPPSSRAPLPLPICLLCIPWGFSCSSVAPGYVEGGMVQRSPKESRRGQRRRLTAAGAAPL